MESLVFGLPPQCLWGFAGSMAVEIIVLHESWDGADDVPAKYKKIQFWVVRFLVACVGGGLAYAYGIEGNPLLAANIGASAPLIIHKFKTGARMPAEPG
jgi:hypothetical protein